MYAVPILLVITVLVVFQVAKPTSNAKPADAAATDESKAGPPPSDSFAYGEAPRGNYAGDLPSAELPQGGEFTQQGAKTWHVVKGTTEPYGSGDTTFTYSIEVEDGIDPASIGGDEAVFARSIDATLKDPRSWAGSGKFVFQRVDSGEPNFRISLTTPETTHLPQVCGQTIKYESSCYVSKAIDQKKRVVINLARWDRGAVAYGASLDRYRQYAINHEVGHALGKRHEGCKKDGDPAPVMMQQSFSVSNNTVWDLNQGDPANAPLVAKDGKTCVPNPWPNPTPG